MQHLKRVANECGLSFGERKETFNSRRAQELGKWAESKGCGEEYHLAVFRAYFAEGLNIAKLSVLSALAESTDLDVSEAQRVLNEKVFKESVDRVWEYSRANSINAVPTFMADGRTVVGAQPYEEIEKLVLAAGASRIG